MLAAAWALYTIVRTWGRKSRRDVPLAFISSMHYCAGLKMRLLLPLQLFFVVGYQGLLVTRCWRQLRAVRLLIFPHRRQYARGLQLILRMYWVSSAVILTHGINRTACFPPCQPLTSSGRRGCVDRHVRLCCTTSYPE